LVVNQSTGDVVQRVDFDAWGNVVLDTSPGWQPFGFGGGLRDGGTGIIRFGARDYFAEIARWTSRDPIRFGSHDWNFYVFVANDPVNQVDPSGRDGAPAPAPPVSPPSPSPPKHCPKPPAPQETCDNNGSGGCNKSQGKKRCSYHCPESGTSCDKYISCGPGNWDPPCPATGSCP
jgi:RHS repeat-associated protein